MNMNFDLRYVSAATLITSLLLSVNPAAMGTVGVFVVEATHFVMLCLYLILAIGFTSIMIHKDKLITTYLDQHSDKVTYDPNKIMESKVFKTLSLIVSINVVILGIAIYSGWWITTIIIAWAILTTISGFTLFAKIRKNEVK